MTRNYFALWVLRDGSRDWAGPFPAHAQAEEEIPGEAAASIVTMTTVMSYGEHLEAGPLLRGMA